MPSMLQSTLPMLLLCATQWTAAHQAPLSLGFSRQEHWSGLPFSSPMHEREKWKWSHSVMSYSLRSHGLLPDRLPCPWDSLGKNTGVHSHSLLQRIEPKSPALQSDSLLLSHGDRFTDLSQLRESLRIWCKSAILGLAMAIAYMDRQEGWLPGLQRNSNFWCFFPS